VAPAKLYGRTLEVTSYGVSIVAVDGEDDWYNVHALVQQHRSRKTGDVLSNWQKTKFGRHADGVEPFASAVAQVISVDKQDRMCVNRAGLGAVLLLLYDPEDLQRRTDAADALVRVAEHFDFDLDAPAGGEEGMEGEAGKAGEAGEAGKAGKAGKKKKLNYKQPPKLPARAALEAVAAHILYEQYKAYKAVQAATKPTSEGVTVVVDGNRGMLDNKRFWEVVGKASPPKAFSVRTKTEVVAVPMDGSYLLQSFRVRAGLLAPKDLERAESLGRVELEVIFRQMSQKYRGTPFDLGMFLLTHGTSQAAINMLHHATGVVSPYSTLIEERKAMGDGFLRDFWKAQMELPDGVTFIWYMDNYFARTTCVPRCCCRCCCPATPACCARC
jgi:hypothetical protein